MSHKTAFQWRLFLTDAISPKITAKSKLFIYLTMAPVMEKVNKVLWPTGNGSYSSIHVKCCCWKAVPMILLRYVLQTERHTIMSMTKKLYLHRTLKYHWYSRDKIYAWPFNWIFPYIINRLTSSRSNHVKSNSTAYLLPIVVGWWYGLFF